MKRNFSVVVVFMSMFHSILFAKGFETNHQIPEKPNEAEIRASTLTKLDGVTDNTLPLQKILDEYSGKPLHLIVDGNAVGYLRLHSNTHISILKGFTWTVTKGSNKPAFETYEKSRTKMTTENVVIDGGGTVEFNGNTMARYNTTNGTSPTTYLDGFYADGNHEFVVGMRLYNIDHLTIRDLTLFHAASFSIHLFRNEHVLIENVSSDAGPVPILGTDMIHCNGYVQHAVFNNITSRVYDDVVGLNADDGTNIGLIEDENILGPYVTSGPITDIVVSNVTCLPGSMQAFRMLSKFSLVDNITLKNFKGSVTNYLGNISGYIDSVPGNFGDIRIEDFNLTITERQQMGDPNPVLLSIRNKIKTLSISNLTITPIDNRDIFSIVSNCTIGKFDLVNIQILDSVPAARNAKIIHLDGELQSATFKNIFWNQRGGKNYFISGTGTIKKLIMIDCNFPDNDRLSQGVTIRQ